MSSAVRVAENYQWEMTLKTGDVNNDGTPDILIAVHDMLRVYDGKTFTKIAERSFQSDHNLTAEKAFYLRVEVVDIDKNGKNDILVTTSSNMSNVVPKFHLFLNGNLATTDNNVHLTKELNIGDTVLKTATFAVGDINGDNLDEIVFHVSVDLNHHYVTFFNYTNKSFTNLAELCEIPMNSVYIGPIVLRLCVNII